MNLQNNGTDKVSPANFEPQKSVYHSRTIPSEIERLENNDENIFALIVLLHKR